MPIKTTIYLPEDLKSAVSRESQREGISEAEVIRRAISAAVTRPTVKPGLFRADPFADRAEELLAGFGET